MNLAIRKSWLLALRLLLTVAAITCFAFSIKYFDGGMPYVAETSSNPHPSETAKVMGQEMMANSTNFLISGLVILAVLFATLFVKTKNRA
jgi:hypothetical protein